MTLADFNQDGKLDLAVTLITTDKTPAGFAVLLGNSDGTFQPPVINPLLAASIAAMDVNDDGVPDLIVNARASTGGPSSLYYLVSNGDGSFQPEVNLNLPGAPLLIADVNSDGKPDLVSGVWPLGLFSLLNLTPGPPPFRIISSASFALGPVAADSFVSAFGTDLPASISGLSIQVTDSAGASRMATPIYASAAQLNFLMPAAMSNGVATVSIASPETVAPLVAQVDIVSIAPGLFTGNAAGLAAAYAVRVDSQGNQTFVPVSNASNGAAIATPIDLGLPTDRVYLILFGTGFDTAASGTVNVTIAGQTSQVSYVGPQGLAGLDQINVLIPQALAGNGDSPVVFSVGGLVSNTVHVTIQ